jgi:hypothetical protein
VFITRAELHRCTALFSKYLPVVPGTVIVTSGANASGWVLVATCQFEVDGKRQKFSVSLQWKVDHKEQVLERFWIDRIEQVIRHELHILGYLMPVGDPDEGEASYEVTQAILEIGKATL